MDFIQKSASGTCMSMEQYKMIVAIYLKHFDYRLSLIQEEEEQATIGDELGVRLLIRASNELNIIEDNANNNNDVISINTNDYNDEVRIVNNNDVIIIDDDNEVISISDDDPSDFDDSGNDDIDDSLSSDSEKEDFDYEANDDGDMEEGDYEYEPGKTRRLFVGKYAGQKNFINV